MLVLWHEARQGCLARLAHPDFAIRVQTRTAGGRNGGEPRAVQQAGVGVAAGRVDAAVSSPPLFPDTSALLENGRICQRDAVELVLIQIRDDLVTVLNEGDGPAKAGFRADVADDEADRSAREPRVGHQRYYDPPLAAQRGNARGWVEHLRHTRRAARTLVPHDDHVVVLEPSGCLVERRKQVLLALKHARFAAE